MTNQIQIERQTYAASLYMLQAHGLTGRVFVDIGAAEGAFFVLRNQYGLFPGASHYFIDAMAENQPIYDKLASKHGTRSSICALSCMEGEVVLDVDPNFYNTHIGALQPSTQYKEQRKVRVTTLDRLLAENRVEGPYLIKLDVQGAELDVLRGAIDTLGNTTIVVAEIQIFFKRDNLVELLLFMQSQGFLLFDITDMGYFNSTPVLYQCYATFIPKSLEFRHKLDWTAPGQLDATLANLRARRESVIQALEQL